MVKHEPNAAYHATAALSKSRLWNFRRSPAYFRAQEDASKEERSEAFTLGSAFHKLVLEPDGFTSEFTVAPNVDRRTKDGKAAYAAFLDEAAGKDVLTPDAMRLATEMAEAVKANQMARFLTQGAVEESYYFTDDTTGIDCKVRPDCFKIIDGKGIIVDLKSCKSAAPDDFRRDAISYGYDLQAAMYIEGVKKEHGIPCDFIFIAVEKEPPYLINIMQCDELLIKRGYDMFREYLGIYKDCTATGNWYGYNGALGIINNLSLPAYLAKEVE